MPFFREIYEWVNPLMLTAAKSSLTILMGEMFIRRLSTTLLQIFCKIILNSEVIVKIIIDPDDNLGGTPKH